MASIVMKPKILFRDQENDYGQLEYKYKLTHLSDDQFDRLTSQLKHRLNSSDHPGQAIYNIGLTDDGFALGLKRPELDESLKNFSEIVSNAGLKICDTNIHEVIHYASSEDELLKYAQHTRFKEKSHRYSPTSAETKRTETYTKKDKDIKFTRYVAEVIIRNIVKSTYIDLRLGVAGNVDAGKSTLLGVLTKGVLDNGNGSARLKVFNFKHEITTGRTSSVGQQIMGFDDKGNSVVDIITKKNPSWEDVVKSSTKVITFFDLAGHESYLKTTIKGISSNKPDYCLIMVGSNIGSNEGARKDMTVEHIKLCMHMKIPFIIVMTKVDLAPPNIIKETLKYIKNVIKKMARRVPYLVQNEDDLSVCIKQITSIDFVPIFKISNVNGLGLPLFKKFLNYIPPRKTFRKARNKTTRMQIQDTYTVDGVGTVVGGMIVSGKINVGDNLKIGPDSSGKFQDAYVRSIQCKTVHVKEAFAGSWITVNLPRVKRESIRKGMYLLSEIDAKTNWEFIAGVFLDSQDSINLKVGYQPFCHIGHITQHCKVTDIISISQSKDRMKKLSESGKIMITKKTQDNLGRIVRLYQKHPCLIDGDDTKTNLIRYKIGDRNRLVKEILESHLLDPRIKDLMTDKIDQKSLDSITEYLKCAISPNLGPGDSAKIKIRFCARPEVIFEDEKKRFIFREGLTRGIGRIIGLTDTVYEPLSNKRVTKANKRVDRKPRRNRKK